LFVVKYPVQAWSFVHNFFSLQLIPTRDCKAKKNCHHLWYSLISFLFLSFPFGEYSHCLFIIINYNKNKCSFEISKPCRTCSRALFDIHLANVSFWKPYQHICFTLKYWFIIARPYIFASNLRNCKCVINVRKFTNEDFFDNLPADNSSSFETSSVFNSFRVPTLTFRFIENKSIDSIKFRYFVKKHFVDNIKFRRFVERLRESEKSGLVELQLNQQGTVVWFRFVKFNSFPCFRRNIFRSYYLAPFATFKQSSAWITTTFFLPSFLKGPSSFLSHLRSSSRDILEPESWVCWPSDRSPHPSFISLLLLSSLLQKYPSSDVYSCSGEPLMKNRLLLLIKKLKM
jgi:hypothetical protein